MVDQNASSSGSSTDAETTETVSASSCGWKTTTSQSGECFLEPRTCIECLDEVPTTGETCVLSDSGLCLSLEEYGVTLASAGDAYYLAGNATYCDGSNYSSSDEGCVRVDSCESSTWLSYARQRVPLVVLSVGGSVPDGCSFATEAVSARTSGTTAYEVTSLSSSSSSSKDTLSSADKCTWYQNTTLCSTPRTCYDCLNTVADSGDACTITPEGFCATLSTSYAYGLDFRSSSSSGADSGYHYPSTNTTYCEPSDAACSDCSIAVGLASNSATYCLGSGGCVCVAFCQSAEWQATIVAEHCAASTSASTPSLYGTAFPSKTFTIFLGLAVVVIVAVILGVWRVRRLVRARRRDSMRSRRSEQRRLTMSLELPAWKSMLEELIDRNVDPVGEGRGRLRPM